MIARAPIVETAPAKINLHLHVVGRREDGYHLLDSLAVHVDIGDVVTASDAPPRVQLRGAPPLPPGGPRLIISGKFAPDLMAEPPTGNLVALAARALAARIDRESDVVLALEKNLPLASGIGGGSSDAAATIRALTRLWGLDPADPGLFAVAASLGADVPVCLAARPCHMAGVGEILTEAPPLPPLWMVLANPGQAVATPPVFKARTGPFSDPDPLTQAPADTEALIAEIAKRRNDLTNAAIHVCPEIASVLAALAHLPGCRLSRLSGSGATCFGLFVSEVEARDAATALAVERPDWWVRFATMLARPPLAPPLPDPVFMASLPTGKAARPAPAPAVPFPDTGGWGVG